MDLIEVEFNKLNQNHNLIKNICITSKSIVNYVNCTEKLIKTNFERQTEGQTDR